MQQVSTAHFNYREFPPDDRLPAFRVLTRALYDTWALGIDDDFRAELFGHQVGDMIFNECSFTPARFRHSATHISGEGRDFLSLQAQLAGEEVLDMDHGIVRLLPGHIYLRDWAYPFDSKATEMRMHTIVIPRHRLAASVTLSRESPVLEWPMTDAGADMLLKLWMQLIGSFSTVSLGKAELLCVAFLGFLDGMMSGLASSEQPATLRAMEQFLASRLRGNVGTADLCRQFHVSRSTVFRLFKPHGGVKAYLGRMRLERVYADLRQADPARVGVAEVAASWRFNEPSSFSRKFRQQFGLRPSDVLGKDRGEVEPAVAAMIHGTEAFSSYTDWLSRASNPVS